MVKQKTKHFTILNLLCPDQLKYLSPSRIAPCSFHLPAITSGNFMELTEKNKKYIYKMRLEKLKPIGFPIGLCPDSVEGYQIFYLSRVGWPTYRSADHQLYQPDRGRHNFHR